MLKKWTIMKKGPKTVCKSGNGTPPGLLDDLPAHRALTTLLEAACQALAVEHMAAGGDDVRLLFQASAGISNPCK